MASARREESVRVWCEQRTLLCAYSHRLHSSESCYKLWPSPCTPHKRLPKTFLPIARVSPPSHPCRAHHPSFCFKLIRHGSSVPHPRSTSFHISHPAPPTLTLILTALALPPVVRKPLVCPAYLHDLHASHPATRFPPCSTASILPHTPSFHTSHPPHLLPLLPNSTLLHTTTLARPPTPPFLR